MGRSHRGMTRRGVPEDALVERPSPKSRKTSRQSSPRKSTSSRQLPSASTLLQNGDTSETDSDTSESASEPPLYGGYLTGLAASQDDRIPVSDDILRFQAALSEAETFLQANLEYQPPANIHRSNSSRAATPTNLATNPSLYHLTNLNGYVHPAVRGLRDSLTTPLFDSRLRAHEQVPQDEASGYASGKAGVNQEHHPSLRAEERASSVVSGLPDGAYSNIQAIRFGQDWEIKTWYQAPYPEEFAQVPEGRLWLCEFCLKYFASQFQESRHRVRDGMFYYVTVTLQ